MLELIGWGSSKAIEVRWISKKPMIGYTGPFFLAFSNGGDSKKNGADGSSSVCVTRK